MSLSRKNWAGLSFISVIALLLSLSGGCKKKQQVQEEAPATPEAPAAVAPAPIAGQAPPAAKAPEALPGEAAVRSALKQKDYGTAVSGLIALKGVAMRGEGWQEYRQLNADIGAALAKASATDPKAAQALTTYRMINMSR